MNRQRTIPTLLAVCAVLLSADLAVRLTATAEAQPTLQIAPRVVGITSQSASELFRIWSDGLVELRVISFNGGDWCFVSPDWVEVVDCP